MDKIMALLYFTLSLFGFDAGGSTFVHRSRVDGADALHTRITVQVGVARFECLQSATGQCHYLVRTQRCADEGGTAVAGPAACSATNTRRFVLGDGEQLHIAGLQRFRLCIGSTAAAPGSECATLGTAALL
ncbi:hypothetical protein ACFFGH_17615 [Lysobacter korlensis]|uniref:Secreted protein n=1 Tax=Lysobacter korlensis TaxID=553636 RepID=A0ABV6RSU9_9GAMM